MMKPKLRVNQAAFRPGRGTIEMIGDLRRLMEGATARQLELVMTFVDFRKAFGEQAHDVCNPKALRSA